ncbi:MAG TPA: histidine triad nucleotide-binding protein [Pyrinomonadaceae bacterium]|nr:histidine triad nucleotide-binding protein [Pyrinomonadaceae bacterium]
MSDCIFCKIVAGEIPAELVYEDEHTVAFRDINAQAPTHVLVIPRAHVASLSDAAERGEQELLGQVMASAARVAAQEGLKEGGYRTVVNTGAGAGQSVFHLHAHVLGGRRLSWPPG